MNEVSGVLAFKTICGELTLKELFNWNDLNWKSWLIEILHNLIPFILNLF